MPLVAGGAPVGGARTFKYSEFPGWESATRDQLDALDILAPTILQPARDALGFPFTVTSWLRPRQGSSVHPFGAAVDFAGPTRELTYAAWLWLAQNAADRVGELILEQPKTGTTGHVHVTLPGYGGRGELMYETADRRLLVLDPFSLAVSGELQPGAAGERGSETDPYELPGIVVTVSRWPAWAPYALGGLLLVALARRARGP